MDFDTAFARLIQHEGSYSDHASDPGGRTRYGITEAVARANGYTGDMRVLPLSEARRIYEAVYWRAMRLDELPEAARFEVFDAAVNSGARQATLWVQRACRVIPDGRMGPITVAAANKLGGEALARRIAGERLMLMTTLSHWAQFGRGWARRIASNLLQ